MTYSVGLDIKLHYNRNHKSQVYIYSITCINTIKNFKRVGIWYIHKKSLLNDEHVLNV